MAAVFLAGIAAGTINTVVGSGTLITFPTLLSLGVPPVTASLTNTIGLVPGSFSGAWGYRRELAGLRAPLLWLGSASLLGGAAGALLLLVLPAGVFRAVVPVLILLSLVLVVAQPRLARRYLAAPGAEQRQRRGRRALLWTLIAFGGVYGGYFGAAQGILLLGILGLTLPEPLQRINALKNVLAGSVNGVAGVIFIFAAHVAWLPVVLIAAGATAGGVLGARYGRRLPPVALRALIVAVGTVAIVRLI
jgi:uncharacterized membrane protein YfcA